MRSTAVVLFVVMIVGQFGCSPVYTFQVASDRAPEIGNERLESKLRAILAAQGFQDSGLSDAATGEIGCGRTAPDRTTFEKDCGGPNHMGSHAWVWVHTFTCDGAWRVVIVSSTGADGEAAHVRDELSAAFDPELTTGRMQIESRCRLALE